MVRRIPLVLGLGLALCSAFGLLGCTQLADPKLPQTTVFPASDWGRMIQELYALIFWMALVVFIGVEGFLLYAIIRFRRRREDELPSQTHGHTRLEIAWTVLPSLVLLVIAVPTIGTIFAADAVPPNATQHVRVIGHQWWWEFHYPDLGVVTANELHLPLGQTARIDLESDDVIHSFWIPRMGGKMDVVPNRSNHMWFTPQEEGTFYGQCVEFCGLQHANMRLRLIVDAPAAFDAWARTQRADAAAPITEQMQQGAAIFQRSLCGVQCHTIRGTSAQAKVGPGLTPGPDLTHVGGRTTIAAGLLDNTPENMAHWIRDPQAVKVGTKMIQVPLNDADLAAVVQYLQSLK